MPVNNPITLCAARVSEAGHVFEAIDISPSLAKSRLLRGLEAWKGGAGDDVNRLADRAEILEITQGSFRRY